MASVSDEWLVTVCRDDFRSTLYNASHSKLSHTAEKLITEMEADVVERALRQGHNVIEHSMNLRSSYVRAWMELAARVDAEFEIKDFTDVDVDTCLERDSGREHSVGSKVILDLYQRFVHKKPYPLPVPEVKHRYQPYIKPERGVECIVVDIDGTVAMNNGHRGWYEYDKVAEDQYHEDICDLVSYLGYMKLGPGFQVVFMSGRSEDCRAETEAWLARAFGHFPWDLYMRASGDHRDDAIVKYELFDKYLRDLDIWFVLDDRDRVVKMWRKLGVRCLQVAPGNF